MKKEIKLYNVLFPVWMLLLFPQVWLIVLPGNFIIDSIVLLILMFGLKLDEKKRFYLKSIFKIFIFGILSDLLGSVFLLFMVAVCHVGTYGDELYMTLPALLISAAAIFLFNFFITFRNCEKDKKIKMALTFAVFTAPYTFLIPSAWLYA